MRQSKATQWIHVLRPVLRNTLRTLGDAPCRHVEALREQLGAAEPASPAEASSVAEVQAAPPSVAPPFGHDGTERPIPRPHDATEQKACDRGKNKRPMLKNLLLIERALRMLFLSETHPGRVHDKRLADTTTYPLPAGSQLL
jgi:DDE superfamily endonuclease